MTDLKFWASVISYWTVPREWEGDMAVCVASGPSLNFKDGWAVSDRQQTWRSGSQRLRAIAVNDSVIVVPDSDILYSGDLKFWERSYGAPAFTNMKVSINALAAKNYGVKLIRQDGCSGLSLDPTRICHGRNSGYQALNLAVLFGANPIILLGYDMRKSEDGRTHWFGEHERDPNPSDYSLEVWAKTFETMLPGLKQAGVTVLNATPGSAIECFERVNLRDVIS